jgi:hypothetical protein
MVVFQLTSYRAGIVVGICGYIGITNILSGAEFLLFDGGIADFSPQSMPLVYIALGIIYLAVTVFLHMWSKSLEDLMVAEQQAQE